jgi:type VI secretion system protein ImpL
VPTTTANIWLAGKALFAEAGAKLAGDPDALARFVKRLKPAKWGAAFGGKEPARSILVCVDCEEFLRSGARDSMRELTSRLRGQIDTVCAALGANLPIYVLFTKLDRFPSFTDWATNLVGDEAQQLVGATLPAAAPSAAAAEEQSRRITNAFDTISHWMAGRRLLLLGREHQGEKLPGIYEFPRDFRQDSPAADSVPDRPDQADAAQPGTLPARLLLQRHAAGDGYRVGFGDAPRSAAPAGRRLWLLDAGARRKRRRGRSDAADRTQTSSKRVPEWVFLKQLFGKILLADPLAVGAGVGGSSTNFRKRMLWVFASCLALVAGRGLDGVVL